MPAMFLKSAESATSCKNYKESYINIYNIYGVVIHFGNC